MLRLLFSKMNAGEAATNWRDAAVPSRGSKGSKPDNDLNRSFREEDEDAEYGNEEFGDIVESSQQ